LRSTINSLHTSIAGLRSQSTAGHKCALG
jgi:hypothetical protein